MYATLHKLIRQLEKMTTHHVSISQAIDFLECAAKTNDELIIINVIRESFNELSKEPQACQVA